MPIFGPPNIDKLYAKKNISGLIKALNYKKDVTVRDQAAESLVSLGEQSIPELIKNLKGYDDLRGQIIAKILISIGEPVIPALVEHVQGLEKAISGWDIIVNRSKTTTNVFGELSGFFLEYSISKYSIPVLRHFGDTQCIEALTTLYKGDAIFMAIKFAQQVKPNMLSTIIHTLENNLSTIREEAGEALTSLGVELPTSLADIEEGRGSTVKKGEYQRHSHEAKKIADITVESENFKENDLLDTLTNIDDRWSRSETLKLVVANPTEANRKIIEKAINILTNGEFKPYRKQIELLDSGAAVQLILYSAKSQVFRTDPYSVQAAIPYLGNQVDFLSRQLRSMDNGNWFFALYQLLEAHLYISQGVE